MVRDDPTVGVDSMVVADLSHLPFAGCNPVVSDLVLNHFDDSSGLPLLKVKVNGKDCTVLLDTGSRLNLVSKSFLLNQLEVQGQRIQPTKVLVKGVSGKVFPAVGEVDLSFTTVGGNFNFRFIVLSSRTFPADLLLSYTSIKSVIFPQEVNWSLALSDSSPLPNRAQLAVDEGSNVLEIESQKGVDSISGIRVENPTEIISLVSAKPHVSEDMEAQDVSVLAYIKGEDFHRFRLPDEDIQHNDNEVEDVFSRLKMPADCCLTEVSKEQTVGLLGIDEDKAMCARNT